MLRFEKPGLHHDFINYELTFKTRVFIFKRKGENTTQL